METRRRKRAEVPLTAPSSSSGPTTRSSKGARLSPGTVTSSSSSPPLISSISTRSRTSCSHNRMDLANDSSDPPPDRRGKNQLTDKDNSDKGKEKERVDRDREGRDEIRGLGAEADDGGGDGDDNDSEPGVGLLHHNLTSASSALQGLLRKLGAGLDDLLPSTASTSSSQQNSKLKKILSGLRADGEEGKQIEALTQLCDMLCICTEESLGSFSVDSFVPVLVGLLSHESNPDIMLLAARAITHLCDVLPSSCASVVHYGAITSFCARLLTIDYMDLAEQSLQALKKISQEHPSACLRAGALMAVLSYLEFFSVGVQRVALSTAANMCKKLPLDAADFVMEAVPLLTNLLQYHDAMVLEHACVCLTRITEAFASSPNKLDELCEHGLVALAASLISTSNFSTGQSTLSTSTYTGLIRLLSTFASSSPLGGKTLLQLGISGTLKDILSSSALVTNVSVSPTLSRPPEQIFEIVNLVNELLPPLPEGIISLPVASGILNISQLQKSPTSSEKQGDANGNTSHSLTREKLFNDQPQLLKKFGLDILPVFIQIYGSSVNSFVRNKCLLVVGKLLYFSNADMIQSFLSVSNISSFLAGVLVWKDPHVLVPALQMAGILMDKLPSIFSNMFLREGVVHAVDALILSDTSCDSSSQPSSAGNVQNLVQATSSRTMRRRLRSGHSNSEINPLDQTGTVSPHVSLPLYSLEISGINSDLRTTVSSRAKAFKDNYFPFDHQSREVGVTDDLLKLENLCAKLNTGLDGQRTKAKGKSKVSVLFFSDSSAEEEEKVGIISEILAELSKEDGVSTFEFIASGVVGALLNYFCGFFTNEKVSEDMVAKFREQALKRFKSFISVALPSDFVGSVVPMATLVQRLQNALSSLERFPVVLSHSTKSSVGNTRVSPGLSILSKEVKLRLCRARGEKSLLDYSSNIVAIDPLATIVDIEEFLWPRVQTTESKNSASSVNSESGTPTSLSATSHSAPNRHSTLSKSSGDVGGTNKREQVQVKTPNSSKVKGKGILKVVQDEVKGPQTKNATCKKATLDKDDQAKSNEAAFISEDDDLDASLDELDDSFLIDDDDISDNEDYGHVDVRRDFSFQVCTSDEVHDVKLNEPNGNIVPGDSPASGSTSQARDSPSTDCRNGNSVGQRSSLSFPFAAVAEFMSSSSRRARASIPPKLTFSAAGKKLNRHLTIYQAIQEQLIRDERDEKSAGSDLLLTDGSKFLRGTYRISYQHSDGKIDKERVSHASKPSKTCSSSSVDSPSRPSLLDTILKGELPCDYEKSCPTYNILVLLRILEALNQLASRLRVSITYDRYARGRISTLEELPLTVPKVSNEEFINSKLTPKLTRQIQDGQALCSSSIPTWCHHLTKACPFLFPFETRRQYFYSTAFGLSRALYRLHQQQGSEGRGSTNARELRLGRLDRQKVRVSRNRILDSAARVMEMYSGQRALLEVEYFGEVGTGLGPTLEFYTLLSRALQKADLGMWRSGSCNEYMMEIDGCEHESGAVNTGRDLVEAPLGLFPRPWPPSGDDSQSTQMSKVIEYFRLLGRVMAKALKDGRLLDLPLPTAFYKLVLNEELDLHDICSFDLELGKNLQGLQAIVYRKQFLESTGQHEAVSDLEFHGAPIEDLCLDFTLPGYPDYVFKDMCENVSISNLEDYITLVVDATTKSGIKCQMEAFRAGFNQVFDISSLQIFLPHELDYLLCGRRELWHAETLADYIKFDHGYTAKSPTIINLLEIMGEFTTEQQRAFCQFVTGAPHLPPGGLAVLSPKLTIVRKHSSAGNSASNGSAGHSETSDYDLPSVMTCANYLKLPPYSTKEIMYKKLLYAISEGQGSFDLS